MKLPFDLSKIVTSPHDLLTIMIDAYRNREKINDNVEFAQAIINANPSVLNDDDVVIELPTEYDGIESEKETENSFLLHLLKPFINENGSHPIHWASYMGLHEMVNLLCSFNKQHYFDHTFGSSLAMKKTKTEQKIPLCYARDKKTMDIDGEAGLFPFMNVLSSIPDIIPGMDNNEKRINVLTVGYMMFREKPELSHYFFDNTNV